MPKDQLYQKFIAKLQRERQDERTVLKALKDLAAREGYTGIFRVHYTVTNIQDELKRDGTADMPRKRISDAAARLSRTTAVVSVKIKGAPAYRLRIK